MDDDSFENLNNFGRREVLTILPFIGVMGVIAFLNSGNIKLELKSSLDRKQN